MRVTNLSFDKNEQPSEVTIVMSVDEAAHLAKHCGKLAPATVQPPDSYFATSGLYRCLTGMVFNAYWEDGVDDYLREAGQ